MPDPTTSFAGSFRSLGNTLIATVRDRVELLALELHEEKLRLIQTFIWISLALFTGVMAATFITLSVVYFFWDTARLTVLASFAAFYTLAAVWLIVAFRRFLARQPRPLEATLQELQADQSCIQTEN